MSPSVSGGLRSLLAGLHADVGDALECVGFPLYVLDTHGVVRWLNLAAVAFVGDVVGTTFVDVLAPEATSRAHTEYAAKLLGTKERTNFETVVLAAGGAAVRIEVSSVPLRAGTRVVGVFGVGHAVGEVMPPHVQGTLTPRQHEVLTLLSRGRTTREIAAELGIAEETVRNHVRHLLRRLGAHSRLGAVLEARRLGLD